MKNFFEIDFLKIDRSRCGDAICMRYCIDGVTTINVVDTGYKGTNNHESTGKKIVNHIKRYYNSDKIDNLIVTHNHQDHTGGLAEIFSELFVDCVWMNRPWKLAKYLHAHTKNYQNRELILEEYIKNNYPTLVDIETLVNNQTYNLNIKDAFQGTNIGVLKVLSPIRLRYLEILLDLVDSEFDQRNRGEIIDEIVSEFDIIEDESKLKINPDENDMSIVQYGILNNDNILLTADAGKIGLGDAANYFIRKNISVPKLNFFQIPHHGSINSVSKIILNCWLGNAISIKNSEHTRKKLVTFVSAAQKCSDHPHPKVVCEIIHRNCEVFTTEYSSQRYNNNANIRQGWNKSIPCDCPRIGGCKLSTK